MSGVPDGPAQRPRLAHVVLVAWMPSRPLITPSSKRDNVGGLMEQLEHRVRAITAGMCQVKAGTAGAEAAGLVWSEALQPTM